MAIYSATQLIGKTLVAAKNLNVYRVSDINSVGDKAKPIRVMSKGDSFILDSYLAPTSGYTSIYNITYAARSKPMFTFYAGDMYECVSVVSGAFDVPALQEQGAITVKEEMSAAAKEEYNATHPLSSIADSLGLGDFFKKVKPVLILVLVIVLVIVLAPLLSKAIPQKK